MGKDRDQDKRSAEPIHAKNLNEEVSILKEERKKENVNSNLPWVNLSHIVSALHFCCELHCKVGY